MSIAELLQRLKSEPVVTWFDLGLFLDRFRQDRLVPTICFDGDGNTTDFLEHVAGGVAFVTFNYSVDGVTMEIAKYVRAFHELPGEVPIHLIGGFIVPEARRFFNLPHEECMIDGFDGFGGWALYDSFFSSRLERGSDLYNRLIGAFWRDVVDLVEKLGRYIEDHAIRLLFLVNTNSNAGNVALALANVLVSESLGIPVINNNHDFYWEGGASDVSRSADNTAPGPRDHFFTNAHLGEFFSIIQMIYPWKSRSWLNVNINQTQSDRLIEILGHNPANVAEIGTAVDTDRRPRREPARYIRTMMQVADVLGGPGGDLQSEPIAQILERDVPVGAQRRPLLLGWQRGPVDLTRHNMVLLQPTRIIARKRIGVSFELIGKLFARPDFQAYFAANEHLKLTLLVTGPVANGHDGYLSDLLRSFARLLEELDAPHRSRVLFGLLFSGFDSPSFRARQEHPIDVFDLYDLAAMVLLPSETEGRGLPILESAAHDVPIFVRRYEPEEVYADVIGEHLSEDQRLRVIETSGPSIEPSVVEAVAHALLAVPKADDDATHNRKVVKQRYSFKSLQRTIEGLLAQLGRQLRSDDEPRALAVAALDEYQALVGTHPDLVDKIMNTTNRQYLPGYGRMAFMLYLKSLIDPSFFRVEEQQIRGRAMGFARRLVLGTVADSIPAESLHRFYNSVESLFGYRTGQSPIRHDHSMAYRHRSTEHHPYQDLTPQELTGVINTLYQRVAPPQPTATAVHRPPKAFTDWPGMVAQLCGSASLAIDHREELARRLGDDVPLVYFTGKAILQELELFVVYAIRSRLGLAADEELSERRLDRAPHLAPIYIFKRGAPLGNHITAHTLQVLIASSGGEELQLLLRHGRCKIVETDQISQGIDFRQLGGPALEILDQVRQQEGLIVTSNRHAAMMTDIVNVDRFHMGRVGSPLEAEIMGIPQDSGYVQWVPAGLRFSLAYPTPVQTAADFSRVLRSERYRELCRRRGETEVLAHLRRDAEEKGTPIEAVLQQMDSPSDHSGAVVHSSINGIYDDGHPWSGVIATVDTSAHRMQFRIVTSDGGPKTVPQIVGELNRSSDHQVRIAWNGGYILNAELVGKLGIPESYIGSPLGVIISDGRVVCPPLFNKPAFLVHPDGRLAIKRVSCAHGITLSTTDREVVMGATQRNPDAPGSDPVFYDLLYPHPVVPGDGRVVCRLAGNRIMEIHRTLAGQDVPVVPVGLTLSFPPQQFPGWQVGQELEIQLNGWPPLAHAIEAGPLLLDDGRVCIDMAIEGWKTENSIRTQAARLDYTDMRGPKIAVGLDASGGIAVVAVNGRIRESVGATHLDIARILESRGMVTAMGFDPGGSSTLVVDGRALNVSPYNHRYESNIYSLPPEPRVVANAVIGY